MKTRTHTNLPASACTLLLAALIGMSCCARAQDETAPSTNAPAQTVAPGDHAATTITPATTEPVATEATPAAEAPKSESTAGAESTSPTNAVAAASAGGGKTSGLDLNFNNAPIDLVLKHLSDAAGMIVVLDTRVSGNISVMGRNLTREEALRLLDTELNKNGYAAVRSGDRTIRIMTKQDAKLRNMVKTGNRPEDIPDNDEMATWIIPIRFVEASQLMSDINPFVSPQATIIANQAGNSLIITDVQSDIRHLVEIIRAIDSSAEDVTQIRVWKLNYADPNDMATLLTGLFSDQNNGASTPVQFGGRGGRGGGRGGGFGGFGGFNPFAAAFGNQNANSQQSRIRKRNQVVAVPDPRTSSVAVLATQDLLDQIDGMINVLDQPGKRMNMAVIQVHNANPNDVLQALQDTVGANSRVNSRNNTQTDPFANRVQQNIQNQNNNNNIFGGNTGVGGRRGGTGIGGF